MSKRIDKEVISMTKKEWEALGTQLFGPDKMKWRFVCSGCGGIMSVGQYQAAQAPSGAIGFSCIGRYLNNELPLDFLSAYSHKGINNNYCNYAGGGLIKLNPVHITDDEQGDESVNYFDFDRSHVMVKDEYDAIFLDLDREQKLVIYEVWLDFLSQFFTHDWQIYKTVNTRLFVKCQACDEPTSLEFNSLKFNECREFPFSRHIIFFSFGLDKTSLLEPIKILPLLPEGALNKEFLNESGNDSDAPDKFMQDVNENMIDQDLNTWWSYLQEKSKKILTDEWVKQLKNFSSHSWNQIYPETWICRVCEVTRNRKKLVLKEFPRCRKPSGLKFKNEDL